MLALAIATLPLLLLTLLFALNVVNPLARLFLTSFEIVNETEELLSVTPIGAVGSVGARHPLPISLSRSYYLMGLKTAEFSIPPGSSRIFTYDWDDIQFSEILIRREEGDYHFMATGLDPIQGQYRRPEADRFVIKDIAELPAAEDHHVAALGRGAAKVWRVYALGGIGFLSPVFFILAVKMRAKAEQGTGGNAI
jgi:hypothetical protein